MGSANVTHPSLHSLGLGLALLRLLLVAGEDALSLLPLPVHQLSVITRTTEIKGWGGETTKEESKYGRVLRPLAQSERMVVEGHHGRVLGQVGVVVHDLQVPQLLSLGQDLSLQPVQLGLEGQALLLRKTPTVNTATRYRLKKANLIVYTQPRANLGSHFWGG